MLTPKEVFEIWAPPDSLWSPWAAPALFNWLHCIEQDRPMDDLTVDVNSLDLDDSTAVVLDLPGVRTVRVAMALAAKGHRPVPLFNTSPGPGQLPGDRSEPLVVMAEPTQ